MTKMTKLPKMTKIKVCCLFKMIVPLAAELDHFSLLNDDDSMNIGNKLLL